MYCNFFEFTEKPFDVTPDPKFLYLTPSHQEVLASLIYGIRERRGFLSIIGEVGTGKTTLINAVLDRLDETIKVAYMFNTAVSFEEMLNMVLVELGLANREENLPKVEAIHRLNDFSIEQLSKGDNVVLIVDEAHNLDDFAMENLRLLSNLETRKHKLIQIILSGQPELDAKLRKPELRQLAQRISLKRYIIPLSKEDTYEYLHHRLVIAGHKGRGIFSKRALHLIWKYSEGIPRKINILCDNAFLIGYGLRKKRIGTEIVEEAIRDLTWSPFAKKSDTSVEKKVASEETTELSSTSPHSFERVTMSTKDTSHPRTARVSMLLALALFLVGVAVIFGSLFANEGWSKFIQFYNPFSMHKEGLIDSTDRNGGIVLAEKYSDESIVKKDRSIDLIDDQRESSALPETTYLSEAYNQMKIEKEKSSTVMGDELVESVAFEKQSNKEEATMIPEFKPQKSENSSRTQPNSVDQLLGMKRMESYKETNIMQRGISTALVEEQVESAKLMGNNSIAEYGSNTKQEKVQNTDVLTRELKFVVVKKNDFLCKIIEENYGYFRERLLYTLLSENPDIKDPDFILPGQIIKLPVSSGRE